MLRMEFTGQSVDALLLSGKPRAASMNNNIISAQMDYAGGVKFGIMLTENARHTRRNPGGNCPLQEHHVKIEVLGWRLSR